MKEDATRTLVTFFKALSDESRLRLVGLLLQRPHSVEELAERLELSAPTVSHHLKRLSAAELVQARAQGHHHIYSLDVDRLHQMPERLLKQKSQATQPKPRNREEKVLADFLVEGRLKTIPAQRKKRLVILRHLLDRFEPDRIYPEKEVNAVIRELHDDVATLRRELIINKLMDRDSGRYWRTA